MVLYLESPNIYSLIGKYSEKRTLVEESDLEGVVELAVRFQCNLPRAGHGQIYIPFLYCPRRQEKIPYLKKVLSCAPFWPGTLLELD